MYIVRGLDICTPEQTSKTCFNPCSNQIPQHHDKYSVPVPRDILTSPTDTINTATIHPPVPYRRITHDHTELPYRLSFPVQVPDPVQLQPPTQTPTKTASNHIQNVPQTYSLSTQPSRTSARRAFAVRARKQYVSCTSQAFSDRSSLC